jgi:hypothetical protein
VSALERITELLQAARIAGGWIDGDVAAAVLDALGLDEDGLPVATPYKPDMPPAA